jgi:hypothetical protein
MATTALFRRFRELRLDHALDLLDRIPNAAGTEPDGRQLAIFG